MDYDFLVFVVQKEVVVLVGSSYRAPVPGISDVVVPEFWFRFCTLWKLVDAGWVRVEVELVIEVDCVMVVSFKNFF